MALQGELNTKAVHGNNIILCLVLIDCLPVSVLECVFPIQVYSFRDTFLLAEQKKTMTFGSPRAEGALDGI